MNQVLLKGKVKEEFRKTNIYKLNEIYENIYKNRFDEIKPIIEKHFNLILTNSTHIQVLEYTKGCYYKKHADDSSEIVDFSGNTIAFKNVNIERKISTVLFASEFQNTLTNDSSFNGGELKFNYLYDVNEKQIKFKPSYGDLIAFPSNPIFSHQILKVQDGYRLTLVQWHDAIIN
jgi:SM-20-related protein